MKPLTFLKKFFSVFVMSSIAFSNTSIAASDGIGNRIKEKLQSRKLEDTEPELKKITEAGDHAFTIKHDGLTRKYKVHVPANYNPVNPTSLLFALHGGGGNMDYQSDDSRYGLISKSEKEGFIVVFPNGYSKFRSGKLATWNAGNCCADARDKHVDDVGFIRKIVNRITHQMNINPKRIYATGMSNGGMMSYRLACEMPDIFSAIAPVAGTDNTVECKPAKSVAVLHIHALNDSHVLFNGGAGPDARDKPKVTDFTSVPNTISKWENLNSCSSAPQRVLEKPGAYCDLYSACQNKTEVQLCVTETGGHSWPGGWKGRAKEAPSTAIIANDIMWDFFNRQPR